MDLRIGKAGRLEGEIRVPGDKSISHRAVMLGALARGTTEVTHFLTGEDCFSTIACFKAMGVEFINRDSTTVIIKGRGLNGLKEPEDVLNVGNSGTTIRLMMGILAGQPFFSAVTGDASIRNRPMGRVAEPLREMGAHITGRHNGTLAPLAIQGGGLKPIDFTSPVASAQVKSAVLLAGLFAGGRTTVREPYKSRDHTERMLGYLGAAVEAGEQAVTVTGNPELEGKPIEVPGDISSAAFFMVAAAVLPGSSVRINRVGINPTRTGIIEVLRKMGAEINIINEESANGEPVADIIVSGGDLHGAVIEGPIIPRLIDEIPAITVAAVLAKGETVIRDAAELKVKESDRIATMARELRKLGAEITELEDGMIVNGGTGITGGNCESHGDHRVAMSLAVAGLAAVGETVISGAECIDISFPGFAKLLSSVVKI